jgi:HAMP domain-containing protein
MAPPPSASAADTVTTVRRTWRRVGMRWKLLIAFGGGFTLIFILVAFWILRFSTQSATDRVQDNLRGIAVGGATTIDAERFAELVAAAPADPARLGADERYPDHAGFLAGQLRTAESEYPTDARYWDHVNELVDIRLTNPEASPYSYLVDESGELVFVGSWGAIGFPTTADPPDGARFLQPADEVVPPETLEYFARGAAGTTEQPAYTDQYGTWISTYTPIVGTGGETVGVLGVDYPLSYVDEVRSNVLRVLYPLFGGAYLVLLVLVIILSGWLTRRLARLSAATRRVAEGEYELDLTDAARTRFPDEMTELADSFGVMTKKVGARERTLVQQVRVLKVEIDEVKRQQAVAEMTDTDFFSSLTTKAAAMRAKVRGATDDEGARDEEPAGHGE